MLYKFVKNAEGMVIGASDGEIGRVADIYFDDAEWVCRFFVVKTGTWFNRKQVLLSPHSVRRLVWRDGRVETNLTRDQVRSGPDIDTQKPVSRQHEVAYYDHYGFPYYWSGPHLWGPFPSTLPPTTEAGEITDEAGKQLLERRRREREQFDPHLRSANEVVGYSIAATDGSIGSVEDLLFDEDDWQIRYLIVDTRKWLPGKHVIVAVDWVERVSWSERKAFVGMTKDSVRSSPEYDPQAGLSQEHESSLHAHYGRERQRPGFHRPS